MQINLHIHRRFSSRINRARLTRLAQRALRAERARGDVTIVITTDAAIRALNRQFHASNAATDVLAFPSPSVRNRPETRFLSENGSLSRRRPNKLFYLGDIIISYESARANARRAGWRIADELDLLVVHGILHLLGYEDTTPRRRAKMWRKHAEILGRVIPEVKAGELESAGAREKK